MEFGSSILDMIAAFYSAPTNKLLEKHTRGIKQKFAQLEKILDAGPFFMGQEFCVVDAVFGPIFRYFDVFDGIDDFGFFADFPKIRSWRAHVQSRPSVQLAVRTDYAELLRTFLIERNSALSRRIRTTTHHYPNPTVGLGIHLRSAQIS